MLTPVHLIHQRTSIIKLMTIARDHNPSQEHTQKFRVQIVYKEINECFPGGIFSASCASRTNIDEVIMEQQSQNNVWPRRFQLRNSTNMDVVAIFKKYCYTSC